MANIIMQRKLNMDQEQIQQLAERVGEKLERQYGVQFNWSGQDARIQGPGINGTCKVCEGSIDLNLKLGLLLSPFKDKVEQEIDSYLTRVQEQ